MKKYGTAEYILTLIQQYVDTAYMVWTEQVDYDECRKTIESFGH